MARDVTDRREGGRLSKVHTLQIWPAVRAADRGGQSAIAVLLDDVLEDGARLEEHETVVVERGKLAGRRVLLERVPRRFEGDGRELVRHAELLQQPDDSNRAGELCVVELDHRRAS